MKIYLATSWKNNYHTGILHVLRRLGHEVYDFKNPSMNKKGFSWESIDKEWKNWNPKQFIEALKSPIAQEGYNNDITALNECDACVYILPCGRSASWELGYAMGKRKKGYVIMLDNDETPDLMFMEATILTTMDEVFDTFEMPNKKENITDLPNRDLW